MSVEQHTRQPDRPVWLKSSYSGTNGGDCVEVSVDARAVRVRDSKRREGPVLAFPRARWTAFTAYVAERRP
ncbi:DUF397 domain-containing protein [Streptomyces sp. NPDC002734]|uniref:DUF397 domain-containing protein n=1 Tax=Streptomyces sp. NPDC002734 TaxID=3154426 RepID=UPI00331C8A36